MIETTIAFVQEKLQGLEAGHDWFHIERVYKNALLIARDDQEADLLVVQLGALLHDIADSKFHNGDEELGPRIAREFMEQHQVESEVVDKVVKIIQHISFKGGVKRTISFPELDIVQDADRLDAIGAIGIARVFNYGGFKNRTIYNPEIEPKLNMSKEEYKNSTAPTINHFYEKLLLLKDRMNTIRGKEIAQERHDFMVKFLDQFYSEWNGEK